MESSGENPPNNADAEKRRLCLEIINKLQTEFSTLKGNSEKKYVQQFVLENGDVGSEEVKYATAKKEDGTLFVARAISGEGIQEDETAQLSDDSVVQDTLRALPEEGTTFPIFALHKDGGPEVLHATEYGPLPDLVVDKTGYIYSVKTAWVFTDGGEGYTTTHLYRKTPDETSPEKSSEYAKSELNRDIEEIHHIDITFPEDYTHTAPIDGQSLMYVSFLLGNKLNVDYHPV